MGILQMIMIYNLFLSLSIYLWSFIWIRKGNLAGFQAAITGGILMFCVSFAVFIKFDRIDMLFFDSIRAVALVIFGLLAFKEHKKHHTTGHFQKKAEKALTSSLQQHEERCFLHTCANLVNCTQNTVLGL
jgi:hypothetical protein